MSNNPRETTASAKFLDTPRYRLVNREQENNEDGPRIQPIHPHPIKPSDIELRVNRLAGIFKDSWEGCNYDSLSVEWPGNADSEVTDLLIQCASSCNSVGPDSLQVEVPGPLELLSIGKDGEEQTSKDVYDLATWEIKTTFHVLENKNGVACVIAGCVFRFTSDLVGFWEKTPLDTKLDGRQRRKLDGRQLREVKQEALHEILTRRNQLLELPLPHQLSEHEQAEPLRAQQFYIHTGQEFSAFLHAASDGKSGRHLTANEQRGALRHQRPGASYFHEIQLLDEEREAGHGIDLLRQTMEQLDVDDGVICLYISRLLAPPGPLPDYASAKAWVDLDDVARKTLGGYAPNPKEAEQRREKIYHAIRWAARAHIGGKRSITYSDKQTRKEIPTEIYTTPWQIVSREVEAQTALWQCDVVPRRIELVASREWTALTTNRNTAQYLPFGEIIGAIPSNQPSGAWARALGLSYLHWCRLNLEEALRGEVPTHKKLLDQYPPKKAPYEEILKGRNPSRVLDNWQGAESHLEERGLIEVLQSSSAKSQNRKGWQAQWEAATPPWRLGPILRPVIEELVLNRFKQKPTELNPAKRRLGRPRKQKPTP